MKKQNTDSYQGDIAEAMKQLPNREKAMEVLPATNGTMTLSLPGVRAHFEFESVERLMRCLEVFGR